MRTHQVQRTETIYFCKCLGHINQLNWLMGQKTELVNDDTNLNKKVVF